RRAPTSCATTPPSACASSRSAAAAAPTSSSTPTRTRSASASGSPQAAACAPSSPPTQPSGTGTASRRQPTPERPSGERAVGDQPALFDRAHGCDALVVAVVVDERDAGCLCARGDQEIDGRYAPVVAVARELQLQVARTVPQA